MNDIAALIKNGQGFYSENKDTEGRECFLAALEQLVQTYQHEIVGFCANMLRSSGIDSESMAQDIFLGALKSMGNFRQQASLRTWLYKIAHHVCFHALRDETRHRKSFDQYRSSIATHVHRESEIEADKQLEQDSLYQLVEVGLSQIESQYRDILVMSYMTELTTNQIAEILQIKPDDVRTRRSRALQRLRRIINNAI